MLLCAGVFVGGCASVPKDAGFSDVNKTVSERLGQRIHWNNETEADREVAQSVDRLLHRELSAEDAVQVALLDNQNLQATYEELGIAQAELVEAGLLRNPTLSAEIRFPKSPNYPFEIDFVGDFIDLLMMPIRKRAAGAAFEAAKLRVTDEVLKTAAEVKIAFYRAQGAQQLLEVRRSISAATEASFEAARRLHHAGNITDLDLAEERAMFEQSKIDLTRAEAEATDAREALSALMGAAAMRTKWTMARRLPELVSDGGQPASQDLESLAVAQRADLAAARQDVERAAQSLGITKSTALISAANVFAHVEGDAEGPVTAGPGIEVPIPIFNQGQPAIAAQQARLRQSRRKLGAMDVQVRGEVRRARISLDAARTRAEQYAKVIVPLRHQIVEEKQLQYNAMLIGVFQLLAAKRDEIDAGREYVESLRDYWIAQAELERAVGGRLSASKTTAAIPTTAPATSQESQHEQGHQHEHHHH